MFVANPLPFVQEAPGTQVYLLYEYKRTNTDA